ncbi:hypothetical protein XA68_12150 [Ophiocordyceps unilateralis]|uniref:Ribosomal protein L17 n=1 Tax=Ophiocordyceps unilateralis TaxID=268505 RepID=A0A2A9PPB2_OPHUN|nr:hypothetical protein XA68_12150 [Ophiocordyceps unilateralis]
MAGGEVRYRHLSRKSSARVALLRGLVTQLVQYEHIQTTYAKAKEAQRMAEKLITLAKKNNEPARRSAHGMLYMPLLLMPKLFGEIRNRYLTREGGYTRVLRTEPKKSFDQAESAILEFVDGARDSRFMMTAKAVARDRILGRLSTPLTQKNVKKVTLFRSEAEFQRMVERFIALEKEREMDDDIDDEDENQVQDGEDVRFNTEDDVPESSEAVAIAEKEKAAAKRMGPSIVPEAVRKAARWFGGNKPAA